MNTFFIITVFLLAIAIVLLSLSLFYFIKKSTYLTKKEKDFLIFVIDIYEKYSNELGMQSEEQHKKLCEELNKIKEKHLKDL